MEALVFRYLAATAGSLWAWAAVLAAAVSFWRLRSASPRRRSKLTTPAPPLPTPIPQPTTAPAVSGQPSSCSDYENYMACFNFDHFGVWDSLNRRPRSCSEDGGSGTFTAYFKTDELGAMDEDGGGGGVAATLPRRPEGLVMRGSGDLGWYRFQDLSVMNGSVVRLWDGGRRRTAPAVVGWRGRMGS